MNTIVLGFKSHANGKGIGSATLIAGPEVSGHEQAQILAKAKSGNKFPQGVSFLQMAYLTPRMCAIAAPVKTEAKAETPTQSEPKKDQKK